jgi:phage-related protein (TIGR01555 family)
METIAGRTDNKITSKKSDKPIKPKLTADSVREQLQMIPERTANAFKNLKSVKKEFALPITMSGVSKDEYKEMNMAFDSAGGFNAIYESLTQHAYDLGQYPITSFVGYGVLQQIAQQGLIRACIQTVSDDLSRKWIKLDGCEDPEKLEILENKLKELHVKDLFHKAVTTTGYMGGAFLFIDTGEDDLTLPLAINDLSAELKDGAKVKFVVVDPVNVSPIEYNCIDPLRDDYMRPRMWQVLGKRVHASRLLTFVENQPPMLLKPNYNFLGIPQAQILWDYVMHFNQTRASTARLLEKISLLVVQTDMDAVLSDEHGIELFDAKMEFLERYRNNDSVFVCDKESEGVMNVQTTIAGCTDVVRQALELIACINRTPAVKLLGISPSGFNATGESDLKNYYDYIASKQELYREQIQTIINVIQLVEFGNIDPAITFKFEPLNEENKASQAMTAQTKIGALTQLVDRQAMSAEELRTAVREDEDLGLSFLDEELPEELENATQTDLMTDDPSAQQGNMFEEMMKQKQDQSAENDDQKVNLVDMAQKSFNNSNE